MISDELLLVKKDEQSSLWIKATEVKFDWIQIRILVILFICENKSVYIHFSRFYFLDCCRA